MRRQALIALAALAFVVACVFTVLKRRSSPEERVVSERALDTMTRDELYELARERDIPGRSKMKKSELIAALQR